MDAFYKKRLGIHQKKMYRYLKYVFNDHISLILLFLMGGFVFYYTEMIKQVDASFSIGKIIVLVIWFASLFIGKLATLVEEADKVFLLPKEQEMADYLKAAQKHSMGIPAALLIVVTGISIPFLMSISNNQLLDGLFYGVMLLVLKWIQLSLKKYEILQKNSHHYNKDSLGFYGISLIVLVLSLYTYSWIGTILSLIYLLVNQKRLKDQTVGQILDWDEMIQQEKNRQKKIYQFINLFTDVPEISSSVKRRKYLDVFLRLIKLEKKQTYLYLYSRSFLRGSEYSGIYLRLLLVGSVIIWYLTQPILIILVSLLFLYLIGFQLLPLYGQFDYMVMTRLYPVDPSQKMRDLQKLLTFLIVVVGCVLSLFAVISLRNLQDIGLVVGSIALFTLFLIKIYTPSRLKKMNRL